MPMAYSQLLNFNEKFLSSPTFSSQFLKSEKQPTAYDRLIDQSTVEIPYDYCLAVFVSFVQWSAAVERKHRQFRSVTCLTRSPPLFGPFDRRPFDRQANCTCYIAFVSYPFDWLNSTRLTRSLCRFLWIIFDFESSVIFCHMPSGREPLFGLNLLLINFHLIR